jgi:hypothetical protein
MNGKQILLSLVLMGASGCTPTQDPGTRKDRLYMGPGSVTRPKVPEMLLSCGVTPIPGQRMASMADGMLNVRVTRSEDGSYVGQLLKLDDRWLWPDGVPPPSTLSPVGGSISEEGADVVLWNHDARLIVQRDAALSDVMRHGNTGDKKPLAVATGQLTIRRKMTDMSCTIFQSVKL